MNKKEICAFSAALVKTVRKYAPYTPNVPNAIFPDNRNEKLFSDYLLTTEMMGRGLIGDCYGDNNTGFYVFENQAQMAHDLNRVSAGICGNLTMFACFLARITDIDKAYEISIAPVTIAKYHVLLVIYNNAYKNTLASSHEFKSMKHLCETFPDRKAAICDPWFWLSTSVEDYKSFCAKADSYQADYLYSLDDYNPDSYEDDLYENETISVRYPIPVSDQTARNDINTPFINLNRFRSELSQQYIHNFNSSVQKFDVPLHQIRMLSINNKSKVRAHYITYLNMRNHKWLYEIPALTKEVYNIANGGFYSLKPFKNRKSAALKKLVNLSSRLTLRDLSINFIKNYLKLLFSVAIIVRGKKTYAFDMDFNKKMHLLENPEQTNSMKTIVYCLSQTNRYPFLCRFFSQELERHSRFDKYDYNNLTALAGVPLAAKYLDDLKAIIYNKCNNLNNLMDENFHSNLSRELRDKESELRDEHEQQKQSALNNSNPVINQAVNNTANVSLSQLSFLKNLSLSSLTDSNSNI